MATFFCAWTPWRLCQDDIDVGGGGGEPVKTTENCVAFFTPNKTPVY
jgi:hypothetical protein